MDKNGKRKTVIINKNFQYKMIGKFIILNTLLMILFGCLVYLFLNSEIESNLQSAHVTYKNVKDMLFPIVLSLSVINILVSSIIIGIVVLYASFKIAGPLYRFNEALKEMAAKNLRPLTDIRADDQLYDCSRSLTEFSGVISDDFKKIKSRIAEIKKLNGKSSHKKEMAEKIKELEAILKEYRT